LRVGIAWPLTRAATAGTGFGSSLGAEEEGLGEGCWRAAREHDDAKRAVPSKTRGPVLKKHPQKSRALGLVKGRKTPPPKRRP